MENTTQTPPTQTSVPATQTSVPVVQTSVPATQTVQTVPTVQTGISATQTVQTTPQQAPAIKKKLCGHALNSKCNFGTACKDYHPFDVSAAKQEYAVKKTLSVCSYVPNCEKPECKFLHVVLLDKVELSRMPPQQPTPNKPARDSRNDRRNDRRDDRRDHRDSRDSRDSRDNRGERGGHGRDEKKNIDIPSLRIIDQIRGKIRAIQKIEEASDMIAKSLKGTPLATESLNRSSRAKDTQQLILQQLEAFSIQIQTHLQALGGVADEETETSSDDPDAM